VSAEPPKGRAWCALHDIYYREVNSGCWYCLSQEQPGQFVTLDLDAANHRGAFRALAEIGLAIAGGEALVFIHRRGIGYHSPVFRVCEGCSCDSCTEARIIKRRVFELLGVEPSMAVGQ